MRMLQWLLVEPCRSVLLARQWGPRTVPDVENVDGRMAFIRTPDLISIELIQKGEPKAPAEPWASAANIGVW